MSKTCGLGDGMCSCFDPRCIVRMLNQNMAAHGARWDLPSVVPTLSEVRESLRESGMPVEHAEGIIAGLKDAIAGRVSPLADIRGARNTKAGN